MERLTKILFSKVFVLCFSVTLVAQAPEAVKEAQRLTRVAQVAEQQKRYDDAIRAYEKIAVIAKRSPAVASGALVKPGRAREAIPFHQRAISLNPKDPSFYFNSAISYLMLGDVKNAQEQKMQLQTLDPAMAEHLAVMIAKRQK